MSLLCRLLGEARPVLEPASSTGKLPALRAAAAEALALLAFVGSEDPDVTDGAMQHLSGLWSAGAASLSCQFIPPYRCLWTPAITQLCMALRRVRMLHGLAQLQGVLKAISACVWLLMHLMSPARSFPAGGGGGAARVGAAGEHAAGGPAGGAVPGGQLRRAVGGAVQRGGGGA